MFLHLFGVSRDEAWCAAVRSVPVMPAEAGIQAMHLKGALPRGRLDW
jgi:hypothetical protein